MKKEVKKDEISNILASAVFKIKLNELADLALDISGTKTDYSDMDLSSAVLVLIEVLFNKEYDKHKDKLTLQQMGELAEETGRTLKELIEVWTGTDLHHVYDK